MGKLSAEFSVMEFSIVIAILGTIGVIIFMGLHPSQQLSKVNNSKRTMDVKAIRDALTLYQADNDGIVPSELETFPHYLAKNDIDICSLLVPKYLPGLPTDPTLGYNRITNCNSKYDTRYQIFINSYNKRVTVSAPNSELGESVEITE